MNLLCGPVENEINQMKINDPKYWVAMDKYIIYFEDWINGRIFKMDK